jgi:hypothetical protein
MLQAQLHGKLTRAEKDKEDLLTSNVFGSISYVPPQDGLIPLLSIAEKRDLKNLNDSSFPLKNIGKTIQQKYEFWPTLSEPGCNACEPDLLIEITNDENKQILILVEAKYKSGKSSEESPSDDKPYDQLAREWDNLVNIKNAELRYLLYITADIVYPVEDIKASQKEYKNKRGNNIEVLWISWRMLPGLFKNSDHDILKDVGQILRDQGLTFFEGFKIKKIKNINWNFKPEPVINDENEYSWNSIKTVKIVWRFLK